MNANLSGCSTFLVLNINMYLKEKIRTEKQTNNNDKKCWFFSIFWTFLMILKEEKWQQAIWFMMDLEIDSDHWFSEKINLRIMALHNLANFFVIVSLIQYSYKHLYNELVKEHLA